jgi:hypothetical protein
MSGIELNTKYRANNVNDQLTERYKQTKNGGIDYAYYQNIGHRERSREVRLLFNKISRRFSEVPFSFYTTFMVIIIGELLWLYVV